VSIFREHKTIADRSASDRKRHKNKIEKAIREGIHSIVEDESIITDSSKSGKTKYRIPVRGIKEYRFVHGNNSNSKSVGSAPGKDIKRGQKIGDDDQRQQAPGNNPGNEKGEEFYDVEISLEELSQYLFSELQLPELQKKQLSNIYSEKIKRNGYRSDGILPRLDKKKSAIARIKRMKAAGFDPEAVPEEESFPFHEEDLKYRHYKVTKKPNTNAVIFFVMDVSGSMTDEKKFLARSFYFLLFQFLRTKYNTIEIVFISHDTEAREVEEKEFFSQGTSGGTIASTGIGLVNEIISARYHPSSWNIYTFQCSDGDNYPDDNDQFLKEANLLCDSCQLYGYCEIEPNENQFEKYNSTLMSVIKPLQSANMKSVKITEKGDIWYAFKHMMGGEANQ
jgi:sporulation protein YhbH